MDIIDVSPDDLVLPGGCLGWAVLDGWTGPVYRSMSLDHRNWKPVAMHCGAVPVTYGGWQHYLDEACPPLRLDCRRPEVRDRLRRVLAVGGRCRECGAQVASTEDCICNGTGYTRQPHDIGHFVDAEIAGRITPLVAAAAWWTNAIRVEAGLRPLISIEGPWEFCDNGRDEWRRKKLAGSCRINFGVWGSTCTCGCDEGPGWHGGKNNGLMSPCKDADDGKRRADNYALVGGHALLNDGSLLLPLPDRIARLRLED